MLTLRFFASLREALDTESEQIEKPSAVETITQLRQWLAQRDGIWAEQFAPEKPLRAAINFQMVSGDAVLPQQGEVAFFPPVTGG
jgi:sulfur-carrier protein